jgi:hypothetical protein
MPLKRQPVVPWVPCVLLAKLNCLAVRVGPSIWEEQVIQGVTLHHLLEVARSGFDTGGALQGEREKY